MPASSTSQTLARKHCREGFPTFELTNVHHSEQSLYHMPTTCTPGLLSRQVATYRAFSVWRDLEDMSDQDTREGMCQDTYLIQELCERGDLQKQRPEAKAQLEKDYLR